MAPRRMKKGPKLDDAASNSEKSYSNKESSEMKAMIRHLQDMKLLISEEVKAREKLGRERTIKLSEMATVEAAIATSREKQKNALEACRLALLTESQTLEYKIKNLKEEEESLQTELIDWNETLAANEKLRRQVYESKIAADIEIKRMNEELRGSEETAADIRSSFEHITRHTLREMDREYSQRATADLRAQAERAQATNKSLAGELDGRAAVASIALDEQTERARKLRYTKVQHELLSEARANHEERFEKLSQARDRSQSLAKQRQTILNQLQGDATIAARHHTNAKTKTSELKHLTTKLTDLQDNCVRRQATTIKLARALARFAQSQYHELVKNSKRAAPTDNQRYFGTSTSTSMNSLASFPTFQFIEDENAFPNTPLLDSIADDDATAASFCVDHKQQRDLSELDLLRIWNSNYFDQDHTTNLSQALLR